MTNEKKDKLQSLMHKIEVANKLRLFFLFVAVVILVLLYFANKFWETESWYLALRGHAIVFVGWDILFMFISTFTKLFFTVKYNRTVKEI